MNRIMSGLRVVELSDAMPGAVVGMMLADHGADVVKVEPPGGSPLREQPGSKVWDRAKRSAVLDLEDREQLAALLRLIDNADVLVESVPSSVRSRLGLTPELLSARNPRLVHCSISPYGGALPQAEGMEAAYAGAGLESLVGARLGLYHEQRGWCGTPMDRILGVEGSPDDFDVPEGAEQGPDRDGPLMVASPWASLATAFNAALGVSAALFAREKTGRGQAVETTLLQGALGLSFSGWQRPEHIDADLYRMWVLDRRAPKGLFECADGRWVHQWPMNPFAVTEAGHTDDLENAAATRNRDDIRRLGMSPDDLIVLLHYFPEMVTAHKKFTAEAWVRFGMRADVGMQLVRSPEEALQDEAFLADGTIVTVDDPDEGPLRQAGVAFQFSATPGSVERGAPRVGEHTEAVLAEVAAELPARPGSEARRLEGRGPLDGIVVLDLGLGVAGPFGTQLLADMGADVIKINTQWDMFWLSMHMGAAASRGKRSLSIDLKDPRGVALVRKLAMRADVVAHNMRTGAAERLGLDYTTLVAGNPGLIYCHSRGFDHGARLGLPSTDQTAGALCGTSYQDGGVAAGGAPFWSPTSMGDTGNGWLSAIGILQALYHREVTGQGQQVDTAIVNACLLATSNTYLRADGTAPEHALLDDQMLGFSALHRLYGVGSRPGTEDWFVVAAVDEPAAERLLKAVGLDDDSRFATADDRRLHDQDLTKELESRFVDGDVATWVARLQAAGVPCEPADARFSQRLFDDPELRRRGWTTSQQHPVLGKLDTYGPLVDFSDTPSTVAGPAPLCGQHSREILAQLGIPDHEIQELVDAQVIVDGAPA
jgi:crotonobetainyl-CoA:carnitine CoA-transferase CaiB-like acyl-CoA transferase